MHCGENGQSLGDSIARLVVRAAGCLLVVSSAAIGADPFAGIDPYIQRALKTWEVPGLAIAVIKDDQIVLARGYGVCEIGTDRKVTSDTRFTIASVAKTFIASCIGVLVDEGKLRWDDPVARHLKNFELPDPYLTQHVTLRDLLCHRTGLRRADLLGEGTGFDSKEILRRLKHLQPAAELRTQLIYNNHTYTVLGEVVEHVSGQSWEEFARQRILQPLEMASTTIGVPDISADRLAPRHWRSDAGIVARAALNDTYSTVHDMAQWLKLQLAEGKYGDRRLLKPATIREMHALQFSVPIKSRPAENPYVAQFYGSGLGWSIQEYRGRKLVLHGGAWGAVAAMVPEERLAVVVLSNLDLEYLAVLLMHDVCDAYWLGPESTWDTGKWHTGWLRNEPPGAAYRPRDKARARLQQARIAGTKPSQPLEKYAGEYESDLYGRLIVRHESDRLLVTLGEYTTPLTHWQDESFYARAPIRLTFDWLLTFASSDDQVTRVTMKHIGWDTDEQDHVFRRAQ